MDLKPGHSVLDVGAGIGFYTVPFAKAVNDTGMVYASDMDQEMIKSIQTKVSSEQVRNVLVFHVTPAGLDKQYLEHTYDFVFLNSAYRYLWGPEDFFRKLQPAVKNGGQIHIVEPRIDPGFTTVEFENDSEFCLIYKDEGTDYPVFKRLSAPVLKYLSEYSKTTANCQSIPDELKVDLISSFNRILDDRRLYPELHKYYQEKNQPNISLMLKLVNSAQLAEWLIAQLNDEDAFNRETEISDLERKEIRRLNRIILVNIFGLRKDFWELSLLVTYERKAIISTLREAGYRYTGSPAQHIYRNYLIFQK
jgi:ubiquinone/menaquinone biosynthesis C-methylase UbiE